MSQGTGNFHTIFRLAGVGLPDRFMLVLDGAAIGSGIFGKVKEICTFQRKFKLIEKSESRGVFVGSARLDARAVLGCLGIRFINLIWGL